MSEGAKKGPAQSSGPAKAKGESHGLWGFLGKLAESVSLQVQTRKPSAPADPVARMAPVREDRREAYQEAIYRKTEGEAGTAPMRRVAQQRQYVARAAAERAQPSRASIPKGSGGALPSGVRAKMEPKLGADLSEVRVHTGGDSAEAAGSLGARAFTVGSDVHFNAGEFAPGSKEGDKLLAHELTHVVQAQKSGIQRKADEDAAGDEKGGDEALEVSDPSDPAEKEADQVADEVGGDDEKKEGGEEKKDAAAEKKDGGDEKKDAADAGAEEAADNDEAQGEPIQRKAESSAATSISAQPAAVAFKIFLAKDKKGQKMTEKECKKAGLHGKEVRTKGGDSPAVASAKAKEAIRALKERIASLEKKLNDPKLVAQERLARSRGVPQAEIDKIRVKGKASLGKLREQIAGIKGELKGIEAEEKAAAALKPDLRNIHILCQSCDGEITEIDMLKGKVATEVKAAASLVDVDMMLKKQDAVEKLWDGEVQVAVAESDNALDIVTKKFESKNAKPPKVRQF